MTKKNRIIYLFSPSELYYLFKTRFEAGQNLNSVK